MSCWGCSAPNGKPHEPGCPLADEVVGMIGMKAPVIGVDQNASVDLTVILEVKVTINIADDDPGRIEDMVKLTIGRMKVAARNMAPEVACIGTIRTDAQPTSAATGDRLSESAARVDNDPKRGQ